jgi:hypothetical protein
MRTVRCEAWDYVECSDPQLIEVLETNRPARIAEWISQMSEAFGADDGEFSRVLKIITQDDHQIKGKPVLNPLRGR